MKAVNKIKEKREDNRNTIIKIAGDIFSRFGLQKTTMDEIASAVHKAKSSIYYYFKSKEAIFQAVLEKESVTMKNELVEAVNREKLPQHKLRMYIITRMKILKRLSNYYSAIRDDYLKHYEFIEKIRRKHDEEEIKMVLNILKKGVKQNIFKIVDLKLTAQTIIFALKGMEYSWVVKEVVPETEKSLEHLINVLFRGIMKR